MLRRVLAIKKAGAAMAAPASFALKNSGY